jgi:hypothetical protein
MTSKRSPRTTPHRSALAAAISENDLERAALLVLLGVVQAMRKVPPDTIDDVLAVLAKEADER